MKRWLGIGLVLLLAFLALWLAFARAGHAPSHAPAAARGGASGAGGIAGMKQPDARSEPTKTATATPAKAAGATKTATRTATSAKTGPATATSTEGATATRTTSATEIATQTNPATPTEAATATPTEAAPAARTATATETPPADGTTASKTGTDPKSAAASPETAAVKRIETTADEETAEPLLGAIAGTLRDAEGSPLSAAPVLAVAADGVDAGETFTDDDGFFLVAGLRPGRYTVFGGIDSALASRIGARGAKVEPAVVSRVELHEPSRGAAVHVRALEPDGAAAAASSIQAVLVAGAPRDAGTFVSMLASEAIWLPGAGVPRLVLPRVPPGVYTLVLLRGPMVPPVAARDPVTVTGTEQQIDVEVRLPRTAASEPPPHT